MEIMKDGKRVFGAWGEVVARGTTRFLHVLIGCGQPLAPCLAALVLICGAGRVDAADVVLGSDPGGGDTVKVLVDTTNASPARHKLQYLAKDVDVAFTPGAVDDPLTNGAEAVVFSATDCQCVRLEPAPAVSPGWTQAPASGPPAKYKWKDTATKSTAQVKGGKIKFTLKGGVTYGLDATPQGETEVQIAFGNAATRFCTRFAAPPASDDTPTRYKAKVAKPGFDAACSPVPETCLCAAGGGVLVESDFSDAIPSHWIQYAVPDPGTATVSLVDGAARFTVTQAASTCCHADAEINDWMDPTFQRADPMPWRYVNVDFRLRTSSVNNCPSQGLIGTGVGTWGWGFWDGTANNFLWFMSLSDDSAGCGYTAVSRVNGGAINAAPVDSDMTQWHDYRIVWRPTDSELYVDGAFVAAPPSPTVNMGLVFWLDNSAVDATGSMVAFLDVLVDQFVELDWVRVYKSRARFTDAAGSDVASYALDTGVVITVDDPDQNLDRLQSETLQATIAVSGSGDSEAVTLTETGPSSGEFRGTALMLHDNPVVAGNGILEAQAGDTLALTYLDADDLTDSDEDTASVTP